MARLFAALTLPDSVKEKVSVFQGSLERTPMRAKMVEKKNLHVSLAFLGEVPEEEVAGIKESLDAVCGRHRKFTAKVGGGLVIPNEDHIRVLALGVSGNGGDLESLRAGVVEGVGGDSHPAHLTVARVREVSDKRLVADVVKSCGIEEYFEVESVSLIKSVLKKSGPRYEVLHRSPLV